MTSVKCAICHCPWCAPWTRSQVCK